jgi:hypothetical protein
MAPNSPNREPTRGEEQNPSLVAGEFCSKRAFPYPTATAAFTIARASTLK